MLNGQLVDLSTLKIETEKLITLDPLVQAVIAADLETQYGYVVKVIDVLKQVGLEKFAVQIEKVTNESP